VQIWMVYSDSEGGWIAEQDSFVLVKLQIGDETPVCPKILHFIADILIYGLLNMSNPLDVGEMGGRRMPRKARSEAVEIDHGRAISAAVLFEKDQNVALQTSVTRPAAFMSRRAQENWHWMNVASPQYLG